MTSPVIACPPTILQFFGNNGLPLAGGSVLTQVGGTNTATYQDSAGATPLPNPIPLNSRGEISNATGTSCQLFLSQGTAYTFTVKDANGNQVYVATYVAGQSVNAVTGGFAVTGGLTTDTLTVTGQSYAQVVAKSKAATTTRNSTTTLANDPELIAPLGVGTWQFEAFLLVSAGIGGGSNGITTAMSFSGIHATNDSMYWTSDSGLGVNTLMLIGATETGGVGTSPTPINYLTGKGSVIVSVAGSLAVQWAQHVSGTQALNMFPGSFLVCTKVG